MALSLPVYLMSFELIEKNLKKTSEMVLCKKNPYVLLKKLDLSIKAKYKNEERNNMLIVSNCIFEKKSHNSSHIYECKTKPDCNVIITFNKEGTKILTFAHEHNHEELSNNEIDKILKDAANREFKRSYLWKKDMNIRIKYKSINGDDMIIWNNYEYSRCNTVSNLFLCVKNKLVNCNARLMANHNLTEVLSDPLPILKHNHEGLTNIVVEKIKYDINLCNKSLISNDPKKLDLDIKAIFTGAKGKIIIIVNNFLYTEYGSASDYIVFHCVHWTKTKCKAKVKTNNEITQILNVDLEHNHEGLTESEVQIHQYFASMDMKIEKLYKSKRGADVMIVDNFKLIKKHCLQSVSSFHCNNNCPAKVCTDPEMTKVVKISNFIHNHEGLTKAEKDLIIKEHEEYIKLIMDPELKDVQNHIASFTNNVEQNSPKLGKRCAFFTCGKYSIQVPDEKFFPFPKHRSIRNEWAFRAGVEKHETIQDGLLVADNLFLCQDHFDSDCFRNSMLKKGAIPCQWPVHIEKKALQKFDYSFTNLCKSCGSLNSINRCDCIDLISNGSNLSEDVCIESTSSNNCIVPQCKSNNSIKTVPTFPLPTDLSLQKAWLNNVPLPSNYTPSKANFYVCLNHFKKYDICRNNETVSIKDEAIPKKFNLPIEQDSEIKKCCLPYCTSNHFNDQEPVITFPFPTNFHHQRQEWIKAIFKQHLVHITDGSICIIHFNPDLVYFSKGKQNKWLKHGAIPSNLFLNELKHKVCCVSGCKTLIDGNVDLFPFPNRNETLVEVIKIKSSKEVNNVKDTRMLWEERVGINDVTNSTLICKNHFDDTCFFMDGDKLCLEKLAVPTQNLPKLIEECLIIPKCTENDVIVTANDEETQHQFSDLIAQNENPESSLHNSIKETSVNSLCIEKPIENRDNDYSIQIVNELSFEENDYENFSHVLNEHDYQMNNNDEIQPVLNTLSGNSLHKYIHVPCTCTLQCYTKFTHENCEAICSYFSKLSGAKEREFIENYCDPVQQYAKRPKSLKFTKFRYHLPLNGNPVRVCRPFFESTLKIKSRRLYSFLNGHKALSIRAIKIKFRSLIEEEIRKFLEAKLRLPSKDTYKEGLTVVSLYRDYVKDCKKQNRICGHTGLFSNIYKNEFKVTKEKTIRTHRAPRKAHPESSFQTDQVCSTKELNINNQNLDDVFDDHDTQMSYNDEIQPVLNTLSGNSNCVDDSLQTSCQTSCTFQCYTMFTHEDRETIYSHFSQLGDTAQKSNFFLKNCEPSCNISKSTTNKRIKYYLPLNENRVRVCCKFFWSTLKMKAINLKGLFVHDDKQISPKTSTISKFNTVKEDIRLFLEAALPISETYKITSLYKDYVEDCQNQNKIFGNFPIFNHIHRKEFKLDEKIICASGSRRAQEKKNIQTNIMNDIRLFLNTTPRLPTSKTKKEGLTLPSLHRDYVKKCEMQKKKYGTLGLFNLIYKSEFNVENKLRRPIVAPRKTVGQVLSTTNQQISELSIKEDMENFSDDDDTEMNNFDGEMEIVLNKLSGNSHCEVYNPFNEGEDKVIKTESEIIPPFKINDSSTQLLNPGHSVLKNLLQGQSSLVKISKTVAANNFFSKTNEDVHNTMGSIKQEAQDMEIVENPICETNFQQN